MNLRWGLNKEEGVRWIIYDSLERFVFLKCIYKRV